MRFIRSTMENVLIKCSIWGSAFLHECFCIWFDNRKFHRRYIYIFQNRHKQHKVFELVLLHSVLLFWQKHIIIYYKYKGHPHQSLSKPYRPRVLSSPVFVQYKYKGQNYADFGTLRTSKNIALINLWDDVYKSWTINYSL